MTTATFSHSENMSEVIFAWRIGDKGSFLFQDQWRDEIAGRGGSKQWNSWD